MEGKLLAPSLGREHCRMFSHVDGRGRLPGVLLVLVSTVLIAVLLVPALGAAARDTEGRKVLEFETMAPVQPPFTGPAHPVRGFGGGGAPWVIASAEGELSANGAIEVHVRGLVLQTNGANPFAQFGVWVSCLTNAMPDNPGTAVQVGNFPATTTGNMDAEGNVALPRPCVAPVILVTTPGAANA